MNETMELEAMELAETMVEDNVVQESLGKKIFKKSLVGICVAGGITGIVILVRKNRDKLDKWRIKRLEKKGYTVYDHRFLKDEDLADIDVKNSEESTENN